MATNRGLEQPNAGQDSSRPPSSHRPPAGHDEANSEGSLQADIETLRRMNTTLEGVIVTMRRAKENMGTVSQTVDHVSTLLNVWTRILSQTEHNQRLLLNPAWQGATQDVADAESEELFKRQERERKEAEALRKREAEERRRAAEEERRQIESSQVSSASTLRGGRRAGTVGTSRASATRASRGPSSTANQPSRGSGRGAATQYGRVGAVGTRGTATARGRGRGNG